MPKDLKYILADAPDAFDQAATVLAEGRLIVYPTETFYGLGADARSGEAVEALIKLKGRGPDKPLPVIVPPGGETAVAARIGEQAASLIERYWPGPLTLVFEGREGFPQPLYGNRRTIGARVSSGEFALGLSQNFGGPIVATSANLAGEPAVVSLEQLAVEIIEGVSLVIDGGVLPGRLGSTVIDVTGERPIILRRGDLDPVDL
jgi:L-threonylcarbamoyladenylate synthase